MGSVEKEDRENMFLLEVLVDHVTIDNNRLNLDQQTLKNLGEACVMFQFLNYPPLVVCQEDFGRRTSHYGATTDIKFNSGKSCLFSFRSLQMSNGIPQTFQIQVSVVRRVMSKNGGTGKKNIATTNIDLGDDFAALMRNSRISVIDSSTPLFQAKGDTYVLRSLDGTAVGEIKVFIRLSCFGQYIVTQFQMGGKENPTYMFKGTERSVLTKIPGDKTKKPVPQIDTSRPCRPPPPPRPQVPSNVPSVREERRSQRESATGRERFEPPARPTQPVDKPTDSKPYDRESTRRSKEFNQPDMFLLIPAEEMERELKEMLPVPPPPGPQQQPGRQQQPVPTEPEGDYKEISAEVKGHTIRIRVPRCKKDGGKPPGVCKYDALGPVCKFAPKLNVCDCNYPIPPELIPRCPQPQQRPVPGPPANQYPNCGCR